MAGNLVNIRAFVHVKTSFPLLSVLSRDWRYFCDDSKKKIDLYETLGISSSATQREIKKAYYDLTLKYHPDKNKNNQEAALKFREVSEAYEVLRNYRLRKRYDRGLPVSEVKKVIKHTVDHKAPYQEFFDSRSKKHSSYSDPRMKEIEDLSTFTQKKDREKEPDISQDASYSSVMQIVFIIAVLVMLFFKSR